MLFLLNRITSVPSGLRDGRKRITSVTKSIRNWHAGITVHRPNVCGNPPLYQAVVHASSLMCKQPTHERFMEPPPTCSQEGEGRVQLEEGECLVVLVSKKTLDLPPRSQLCSEPGKSYPPPHLPDTVVQDQRPKTICTRIPHMSNAFTSEKTCPFGASFITYLPY